MSSRITANEIGGTSFTPILMKSQTVLQIRQVMIQTTATRDMVGSDSVPRVLKSAACND